MNISRNAFDSQPLGTPPRQKIAYSVPMRHPSSLALVLFPVVVLVFASACAAETGLPPLINREVFFDNPEITGAQISPDGRFIAFLKPWSGTRNIWVKGTGEPFSAARLLTKESTRPIPSFFWTRDARFIVYSKDTAGDENFNIFAVGPSMTVATGTEVPSSRDLTGLKGVRVEIVALPKNDPDEIFIGLNDRDKSWNDLYKLKISTGERTLVRQNAEKIGTWTVDDQGQLRLAIRVADNGDQEILRVDAAGFTKIATCTVFENCNPIRFQADGKRVWVETNQGENVDLLSLGLFDPETGKTEMVEADPQKHVDLDTELISERTGALLMTAYGDSRTRRYFKDRALGADYKWLEKKLPGMDLQLGSHTLDEQVWLVIASADTEPGITYLFDRRGRRLIEQFRIREKLPRESLASMKPIRYASSDGLEIPAYLTLPKGVAAKNLPTLVFPHGGPWARDVWGYNGGTQFWANRGYAVLMPNYRGSVGWGKKYENAGNGEWGRKMQDDLTWGVKYLVAQGIADPKRIGIIGGSYGGYATLAGVTFTPDVYRAAVDIVGPSNLKTLLEAIPPYWEADRRELYARMADPDTPEGNTWFAEHSPVTRAGDIKTPLLVVQGANDPRVNRREAEQIVVALRDRGLPVEYILAPDEGHGFRRPVNNMAMYMAAERFIAKYLDGRYQESGTSDVVQRLKEITVDPKTVIVTKPERLSAGH
jgi:dipeptidyl aminopeptidase/acylaminoacyl peptidase